MSTVLEALAEDAAQLSRQDASESWWEVNTAKFVANDKEASEYHAETASWNAQSALRWTVSAERAVNTLTRR